MFPAFPLMTLGLLAFLLAPLASALRASEQFHLSTQTQASACFIKCHNDFCAFHDMPGNTLNFPSAITINCGYDVCIRRAPEERGREAPP